MTCMQTAPPADNGEFRRALYRGEIFLLPRSPASERLVAAVLALLEGELGRDGPIRQAQFRRSGEAFFQGIGRLRKRLYQGPEFQQAVQALMTERGFAPEQNAFDPIRLRVVTHAGHENPNAAPIYYTHRDTWYANPQSQISWWIPLHDVTEAETFVFFPDYFQRPVENESSQFDYGEWIRDRQSLRIGWQDPKAGTQALYPAFRGELPPTERLPFSCRAGEILLFAGAHLHQTIPNSTRLTRFSVDFRTVHRGDEAQGLGAPNVDNRSTGSSLRDYIHPGESRAAAAETG